MDTMAFLAAVGMALAMGSIIGIERQISQHPVGLRTNALVCLGAALFVSLSRLMDHEASPTRIAAQVVTGIGFIGGGVILREGLSIRGLTTAATLWCSAAIGSLCGAGFLREAGIGTAVLLAMNVGLRPISRKIDAHFKHTEDVETVYRVQVVCPSEQDVLIRTIISRHANAHPMMLIRSSATQTTEQAGKAAVTAEIHSATRDDRAMEELIERLNIEPGVSSVSWERSSQVPG